MTEKQRYLRATVAALISLLVGYCAVACVFGLIGFSSFSGKQSFVNELMLDIAGLAGCGFALWTSYLLYPMRKRIGVRIIITVAFLVAALLGFEFGVGIVWLTADKVVRYEQRAK